MAGGRRAHLPEVTVVLVTGTDPDGDAIARPVAWDDAGPAPLILMAPERHGHAALAPGQRVLARLRPAGPGRYEGRTLKLLDRTPARIIGIYRAGRPTGRIEPTDRRSKAEWLVPVGEDGGACTGEIVLAEPLPQHHRLLRKPARIVERLGEMGDARAISLLAIATHAIPHVFPEAALHEAGEARAAPLGERADLRALPLVTIDGEDARDFDDAVFAEPEGTGWRLLVAIADVAHYVPPGSTLDQVARERGNSTYFPDRVVPMLPERLSNEWCSLRPGQDRACLFAELHVDAEGHKTAHRFGRGLMRSAARLTYEQVQLAADRGESLGVPLAPLYEAYRALLRARNRRGTLDLDLPERFVSLDQAGHVLAVLPRVRLDSHRLIEEFMILANVAAAEELERRRAPCLYRVHAPPSPDKLADLRLTLSGLGLSLPSGTTLHPRDLESVLRRVAGTDRAALVSEIILRSQAQAAYSPDNLGHFGLALPRYAHFTSPIRRYADLLVHRSLIGALRLGSDGLAPGSEDELVEIAEHLTATERRSQAAERDAMDRYLASFMQDQVGGIFAARISGVTRFGLFVSLGETGASGIVPRSSLPDDVWHHDEREQTLTGRRTRLTFRLAQEVEVRLAEANPVTGGLVFQILLAKPSQRARAATRRSGRRSHVK